MARLAFLFPGQGSQFPGMGRSLYNDFPAARTVFEEADATLDFALSTLCFEGPEEELKLTENTQPALLAVSISAFRVLVAEGIQPVVVAGHSLGEYSALVAAGSLSFSDALRLVRKRGQAMQKAVPAGQGAMAAIQKLPEGKLEAVLAEAAQGEIVTAANLNSPDQVVIAGHAGAVARAAELAKAAGARRAVMLAVSAPFHCPLMTPAQAEMKPELEATPFLDLGVPLVSNCNAEVVHSGAAARDGLIAQIPSPVLWTQSMRRLPEFDVTACVEVGPGSALTGLLRTNLPEVPCYRFGEAPELEKLRAYLNAI